MSFESRVRTPEVTFGDKFEVVIRFVLTKEGPEQVSFSFLLFQCDSTNVARLFCGSPWSELLFLLIGFALCGVTRSL